MGNRFKLIDCWQITSGGVVVPSHPRLVAELVVEMMENMFVWVTVCGENSAQ